MTAIVIHAAKDLRLEPQDPASLRPQPGQVVVHIAAGGICGSDLHYYQHGGFGSVRLQQPMVLGHEVSGRVAELGPQVSGLEVGQPVAINPSRPCGRCDYCRQGRQNHCTDMRFYGSAMPYPHVQGAFADTLLVDATQCFPLPEQLSLNVAAFAEPLSVALHALRRAGSLQDQRLLVTGCGPIGTLIVAAARLHGALEIVATDVLDSPLRYAERVGADHTVNVASQPDHPALAVPVGDKGRFDLQIDASGNAQAVRAGLDLLKPQGVLVQVGNGGEVSLPLSLIVAKEIELRGSFRFHHEFGAAVALLAGGRLDVASLLSHTFPLDQAVAAFDTAADRGNAMKVQIDFGSAA